MIDHKLDFITNLCDRMRCSSWTARRGRRRRHGVRGPAGVDVYLGGSACP